MITRKTCASALFILLAATLCSGSVFAQTARLRLGTPQVLSPLGSPLLVKIPIDATDIGEPVVSSRFSLGSRPPTAAVAFIERAELLVESVGDTVDLVIRTRNAIEEPAVGIVVREQLANGVRSREFFLLLDPPSLAIIPTAGNRPEKTTKADTLPLPVPADKTAMPPIDKLATVPVAETKKSISPQRQPSPNNVAAQPRQRANVTRGSPGDLNFKTPAYAEGGPRLRLSGGDDLSTRPATTEAERENLRLRQFTLDLDDLTSGLLEREHRIMQLEKQLAGLTARVSMAERVISGAATAADLPKPAAKLAPLEILPAQAAITAKDVNTDNSEKRAATVFSWVIWLSMGATLALLAIVVWRVRSKPWQYASTPQTGVNIPVDVAERKVSRVDAVKPLAKTGLPATSGDAPVEPRPAEKADVAQTARETESVVFSPPEIHFELPEFSHAETDLNRSSASGEPILTTTAQKGSQLPADGPETQRLRELLTHYQDISRLLPRVDLPQRLLQQAVSVYEQGEVDFAKRLLTFAAYSRPNADAYWLALLELLYREKLARDYLFNASLFHEIHPKSVHWDEVARIGYLLHPAEPLFEIASSWSHDPPILGSWLPTNTDNMSAPARTGSFEITK